MTLKHLKISSLSGAVLVALMFSPAANGADRHANYYYPPPQQVETYTARAEAFSDTSPVRRIGFVTAITVERLKRPYPLSSVVFAKGERAQKMIIVSLKKDHLDTIYRVRAYLASLTAVARTTPAFQAKPMADNLTFFDLARMLGFEQITISDGDTFTHQVRFE